MDYREFIQSKRLAAKSYGFDVPVESLNPALHQWQKRVTQWAIKRGRAAMLLNTGLGKTFQQLVYAEQVVKETGGLVMLHCPIGVRAQTVEEATKWGISVDVVSADDMAEMPSSGIVVANYEKLHRFDSSRFVGVVLDESSILKGFTGKTKRQLCDNWKSVDFRLACTATPSPNDHMELGNHAEFLGVMPSNEMLSRWFYNDTMQAGGYKILPHGEDDFWSWVSTWAACISMPSDIGGDDTGYNLPSLERFDHVVEAPDTPASGQLFHVETELTATTVHKEKRRTTEARARVVAELVAAEPDEPWLIWCDTNYEADVLAAMIPGAADLRGNESEASKEAKLLGFTHGTIKRLITKPTIAGFGLNFQHCRRMAFIGLSYSYEQYFQAVRRCWRFGQTKPVHAHVVMAESEMALLRTNERKHQQHEQMQEGMRKAINRHHDLSVRSDVLLRGFEAKRRVKVPSWL